MEYKVQAIGLFNCTDLGAYIYLSNMLGYRNVFHNCSGLAFETLTIWSRSGYDQMSEKKVQEVKFQVELELIDNLQFNVKFDLPDAPDLMMDEPPMFGGEGIGPNAARLIAAGVGNCLAASLTFCLRRAKADLKGMNAIVHVTIGREEGLLRLQKLDLELHPRLGTEDSLEKLKKCKNLFEKYCMVTESLRRGLPMNVEVVPEIQSK